MLQMIFISWRNSEVTEKFNLNSKKRLLASIIF